MYSIAGNGIQYIAYRNTKLTGVRLNFRTEQNSYPKLSPGMPNASLLKSLLLWNYLKIEDSFNWQYNVGFHIKYFNFDNLRRVDQLTEPQTKKWFIEAGKVKQKLISLYIVRDNNTFLWKN